MKILTAVVISPCHEFHHRFADILVDESERLDSGRLMANDQKTLFAFATASVNTATNPNRLLGVLLVDVTYGNQLTVEFFLRLNQRQNTIVVFREIFFTCCSICILIRERERGMVHLIQ